jgi:hypothetical protein
MPSAVVEITKTLKYEQGEYSMRLRPKNVLSALPVRISISNKAGETVVTQGAEDEMSHES